MLSMDHPPDQLKSYTRNVEYMKVICPTGQARHVAARFPLEQLWPPAVRLGFPGHQGRCYDHEYDPGDADRSLHRDGTGKSDQDDLADELQQKAEATYRQ